MTTDFTHIIRKELKNRLNFTTRDLEKLLKRYLPNTASENTIGWKIHDLKVKGIIRHLERGVYALEKKKDYSPQVNAEMKRLYSSIRQQLPYTDLCLTDTSWFNEFMLHQVFKNYLVIEVEKEAAPVVFNRLMESGKKVFLNPDREIFQHYIHNTEDALIVKPLISESPVIEQEDIKVASLEKMLVDCLADRELYSAQSQEIDDIFKNAMEKYNIHTSKLKRYAGRRNKAAQVMVYLKQAHYYD